MMMFTKLNNYENSDILSLSILDFALIMHNSWSVLFFSIPKLASFCLFKDEVDKKMCSAAQFRHRSFAL